MDHQAGGGRGFPKEVIGKEVGLFAMLYGLQPGYAFLDTGKMREVASCYSRIGARTSSAGRESLPTPRTCARVPRPMPCALPLAGLSDAVRASHLRPVTLHDLKILL